MPCVYRARRYVEGIGIHTVVWFGLVGGFKSTDTLILLRAQGSYQAFASRDLKLPLFSRLAEWYKPYHFQKYHSRLLA